MDITLPLLKTRPMNLVRTCDCQEILKILNNFFVFKVGATLTIRVWKKSTRKVWSTRTPIFYFIGSETRLIAVLTALKLS